MNATESDQSCLILACGNPFRGDDGAAWRLAESAQADGLPDSVRVIVQQQWTPELAEDIAQVSAVLFVDCSVAAAPGSVSLEPVAPAAALPSFLTHHVDAASLLRLTESLYGRVPANCDLLVIGAESLGHTDVLSQTVQSAMPKAMEMLQGWVLLHARAVGD